MREMRAQDSSEREERKSIDRTTNEPNDERAKLFTTNERGVREEMRAQDSSEERERRSNELTNEPNERAY